MRRTGFAEWMLARAAGRDRGTTIYGDLTELRAMHGTAWFWWAYVRILVSFIWRTPVAILAAIFNLRYLRPTAGRLVALIWGRGSIPLNDPRFHAWRIPYLAHFSWDVSLQLVFMLWIVLPYVAIRFGLRNRLTYLAGVLLLLSVPVYTLRPMIYQFTGVACAIVIIAALASAAWRRQMIFLLTNVPISAIVFYFSVYHAPSFLRHGPFPLSVFHMRIDDPIAVAVTVMMGPLLYRWILENHKPVVPAQLAGTAHG